MKRYKILFPGSNPLVQPFRPVNGGGKGPRLPSRESPQKHGENLHKQFEEAWDAANTGTGIQEGVRTLSERDGVYIEFSGQESYELITKSLEDRRAGIRLLNVRKTGEEPDQIIKALVYIPLTKRDHFLKKIKEYTDENKTEKGNIKNQPLISGIETIKEALLEAFWTRIGRDKIPGREAKWCEIWILTEEAKDGKNPEHWMDRVRFVCNELKLAVREKEALHFPERSIFLVKANRKDLLALLDTELKIAEIRLARESPSFFLEMRSTEQRGWAEDLHKRLRVKSDAPVSICILDTGINQSHPLLSSILKSGDCHAVDPAWGTHDHDGPGTQMAGVASYQDLLKDLESDSRVEIRHRIESAKILPPRGNNEPHLWGYYTQQGIALADIKAPKRIRIGAMAVTSEPLLDGAPTSWSAAIDHMTSGADDDRRSLFIVSAGNVPEEYGTDYPNKNRKSPIQDPAQSWNALTVSAFTELATIGSPEFREYTPIAGYGELSPHSTTSCPWNTRKWPIKPDLVMEGGNAARDGTGFVSDADDLSILTLSRNIPQEYFTITSGTSPAAMKAAWMAAQIQTLYPEAWPETVRGLLVHSAEWYPAMKKQLSLTRKEKKSDIEQLMKHFGYGVPDLQRAVTCLNNSLSLVLQSEIQPFKKVNSTPGSNEIHYHALPWPLEALRALEEKEVQIRITLSYFIEPGPGEVGWEHRYRYPSHGLRFELNKPTETREDLALRINKLIRDEEEEKPESGGTHLWVVGSQIRSRSTIQSDRVTYSGRQMAETNIIAVYPSGGWWKDRHHLGRAERRARYSLIVSLHTEETDVDIYTPVVEAITGIPTPVPVEIEV